MTGAMLRYPKIFIERSGFSPVVSPPKPTENGGKLFSQLSGRSVWNSQAINASPAAKWFPVFLYTPNKCGSRFVVSGDPHKPKNGKKPWKTRVFTHPIFQPSPKHKMAVHSPPILMCWISDISDSRVTRWGVLELVARPCGKTSFHPAGQWLVGDIVQAGGSSECFFPEFFLYFSVNGPVSFEASNHRILSLGIIPVKAVGIFGEGENVATRWPPRADR